MQGGDTPAQLDGREIALGGDVILAINDKDVRKIDDVLGSYSRLQKLEKQ